MLKYNTSFSERHKLKHKCDSYRCAEPLMTTHNPPKNGHKLFQCYY